MNDILNQYKENPTLISEVSITDLKKPFDETKTAFYEARDAYNDDLKTRRDNLAEQSEKIGKQVKALTLERDKLMAAVTNAVSRTDIELAARLEARLDEKDAEITICNRKIRLASVTELKGDPKLYEAVHIAYNSVSSACDESRSAMLEIASICAEQIQRYSALFEEAKRAAQYNDYHYESSAYEQIQDHFTEGPKRRKAAEEAAAAERRAAEESAKRTSYVWG